ncbi:MAG: hypothetical protein ACI4PR_03935 [Acutalibacteraceae bacterium]
MGGPSKPAKSGTSTNGRLLPKLNTSVVCDFKNFVQRHNKTLNNIGGFQNIQDIHKEWFADKESWEDLKGTKWFEINKSFDVDTTKQDWMSELLDKMLEYYSEDDKKEYRKEDRKKYELAEKIMVGLEACDKEFNKIVDKKIFEENKTDKEIKINDFDGYHNKLKEHLTRLEKISIDLSKLNAKLSNNPNIKEKTLKELKICYKEMMKHVENMKIYTTDTVGKEARAKVNGGKATFVKNIEFITSEYLIPFFKEELKYKNIISGVVNENIEENDKKIRVEDVNNYTIVDKQIDWEARRIYDEICNVIAKLPTEYLDSRDMDRSILEKFNELIKKCNKVADKLYLKRIQHPPSDLDNDDKEGKVLYKFRFYLNSLQNFIYRGLHSEVPSNVKELCNNFNKNCSLYTKASQNKDRKSIVEAIKELISGSESKLEICLEEMNGALEKLEKKPFKKIKNEKKLAEKIYKKFCETVKSFNFFCDDLGSVNIDKLGDDKIVAFYKSIMKGKGQKIPSDNNIDQKNAKEYLERIIDAKNNVKEFPVSKINNNDILRLISSLKDFGEYVYNDFLAEIDKDFNTDFDINKKQIGNISDAYREGDEKYLESNFDIAFKGINLSIKVLSDAIDKLLGSHKLNEKAHKPNEYMEKISGAIFDKYDEFTQRREDFVNDTSPEKLREYNTTVLGEKYSTEWDESPTKLKPPPDNYDPFRLMLDVLGFIMRYKKGLNANSIRDSRADFERRYYSAESFKDASEVVNEVYKKAVEDLKELMFAQDQLEKVSSGEMSILPIKDLVEGLKNKFKELTKKYADVYIDHVSFFSGKNGNAVLDVNKIHGEMEKTNNASELLQSAQSYILSVIAPLGEKTFEKFVKRSSEIMKNFGRAPTEIVKSDCLTQMYELAVRAVRHLENAIVKEEEAKKYKGVLGKGKKLLKKGKKLFSKKEENKQGTIDADKIEKCFQNVGNYFVKGKKFTRKEMKNKLKDMKKICPKWYETLEVYLKDNYFKLFSDDGNMPKNEDNERKISIAVLLASLCGLPNTDCVISACEGLKEGGLRGNFKDRKYLEDAVQIRKGIKNAAVVSEGNMDRVCSYMTSLGFQKFEKLVNDTQQMKIVMNVFVGLSNKDSNSSKQWKTAKQSTTKNELVSIEQHRENKNETISIDGEEYDVTF